MRTRPTAVILAGGVAKGAFEAGALEVLTAHGIAFSSIVATSSGALNGTLLAAAVRSRRTGEAGAQLVRLWEERATWTYAFRPSLPDALALRGLLSSRPVFDLLRSEVTPFASAALDPVSLRIVVAAINGLPARLDGEPATTYEGVQSFAGASFDDPVGREAVFRAAAASAAFPVLFAPVDVPHRGPCYDGGLVNNSPVRLAIDDGAECIVLIAPYPAVTRRRAAPRGLALFTHLAEVLVYERLYRDLADAERVNARIAGLRALDLSADDLTRIRHLLGWRTEAHIVYIHPDAELPGNPLAGFFSLSLRRQYIQAGRRAAESALAHWPT